MDDYVTCPKCNELPLMVKGWEPDAEQGYRVHLACVARLCGYERHEHHETPPRPDGIEDVMSENIVYDLVDAFNAGTIRRHITTSKGTFAFWDTMEAYIATLARARGVGEQMIDAYVADVLTFNSVRRVMNRLENGE